jgi:hypothetical protein
MLRLFLKGDIFTDTELEEGSSGNSGSGSSSGGGSGGSSSGSAAITLALSLLLCVVAVVGLLVCFRRSIMDMLGMGGMSSAGSLPLSDEDDDCA